MIDPTKKTATAHVKVLLVFCEANSIPASGFPARIPQPEAGLGHPELEALTQ
jgi:hypothetical protein